MRPEFLQNGHMRDDVFRRLFTVPRNRLLVADIIAAYLELPVADCRGLELLNDELPPEIGGGKSCRLDLLASMANRLVDLELQYGHSEGYFRRNAYTLCRLLCMHMKRGDLYETSPQVNIINFINFDFERIERELEEVFGYLGFQVHGGRRSRGSEFPTCPAYPFVDIADQEFHKTVTICAGTPCKRLASRQPFHYIEMHKVPLITGKEDYISRKQLWGNFFKIASEEDFEKMYKVGDPVLRQALKELRNTVSDEKYGYHLITIEKMERDADNKLYHEKAKSRAEGRAKGKAEGKADAVVMLLTSKFPDCPASFLEQVKSSNDIDWLDQVFRQALTCASWEELKSMLQK